MGKRITVVLFVTSFIPVTVFKTLSRGGAGTLPQARWAVLLGFFLALVQFGLSRRFLKHTSYLERTFLIFLALGIGWIFLAPPDRALWFVHYSTFLLYALMFLMTFLPQLFGYEPFTYNIAKQWYPEAVWKTPLFLVINRRVTYFWSGIFMAAAVSCLYGHGRWPFTIVVPFGFILGLGLPFSRLYPKYCIKKEYPVQGTDSALLPDTARQLVLDMPKVFNPEAGAGIEGEIQFDLSGEGGGQVVLALAGGRCSAYEGESTGPILRIKAPAEIWLKMARGEINRAQALMEGKYSVEGDVVLLTRLGEIFKRRKEPKD
jgi:putative sterol carrier protein